MNRDIVKQVALEGILELARLSPVDGNSISLEQLKKIVYTAKALSHTLEGLLALTVSNGFKDVLDTNDNEGNI